MFGTPRHSGIKQNELIDILAKSRTPLNHITHNKEFLVEGNSKVSREYMKRWQKECDEAKVILHDLKLTLDRWTPSTNDRREVILCRMRLDTYLVYLNIMLMDQQELNMISVI